MEKILVPVDGSEASRRAVEFVIARAGSPGVQVHLLNVQEFPPAEIVLEAGISPEVWQVEHQTAGRKAMDAACNALDEARVHYTTTVAVGNVADQIVARARELAVTQIVMGTRGLSTLASLVLGSVATRVIHAAACPVTLVK